MTDALPIDGLEELLVLSPEKPIDDLLRRATADAEVRQALADQCFVHAALEMHADPAWLKQLERRVMDRIHRGAIDESPKVVFRPRFLKMALVAAAAVLVAAVGTWLMSTRTQPATPLVVARVAGRATLLRGDVPVALAPGQSLRAGDRIVIAADAPAVAGPGAGAWLQRDDGDTVVLDGGSDARVASGPSGQGLDAFSGRLHAESLASAKTSGWRINCANDAQITVLASEFALEADAQTTTASVAQGSVLIASAGSSRTIIAGQRCRVERGLAPAEPASFDPSTIWRQPNTAKRAAPTAVSPLDRGLVGHWTFDGDADPQRVHDSSPSGNDGIIQGVVGRVPGRIGQAIELDGNLDNCVIIGDVDALDMGTDSFTYCLWVNAGASTGYYDTPWTKGATNATQPGYNVELGKDDWYGFVSDGTTSLCLKFGTEQLAGRWVHLAVVVDRAAGSATAYVDGTDTGGASLAGFGSVSGDAPARFGGHWVGNRFRGSIDDVRVYRRALSPDELRGLAQGAGQ